MISAENVESLLNGACDLHIHSGPGLIDRSLNHVEACQEAMEVGMRAIILKDHFASTATLPSILQEQIIKDHPLKVFGGVVLNNTVGGIDPAVVEAAIRYGAKVVWMPTLSARHHKESLKHQTAAALATLPKAKSPLVYDPPLELVDANGKLLSEVKDICQMIAQADIILASGHISRIEADLLFAEALACGVKKIVLTHPELHFDATLDDMRNYGKAGIYLEHVLTLLYSNKSTYPYIYEMIQAGGADHTIISSDLGQPRRPRPVEGMRKFISAIMDLGLTEAELRTMQGNSARLVNLAA
jgi:hypothetical protein